MAKYTNVQNVRKPFIIQKSCRNIILKYLIEHCREEKNKMANDATNDATGSKMKKNALRRK